MVNVIVSVEPAAQADAATATSVSVAQQLGVTAQSDALDQSRDLQSLASLAASRSSREADTAAAQQAQVAADQAELDRRTAEMETAARAAEEAAAAEASAAARVAAAEAAAADAAKAELAEAPTAGMATTAIARISNTAGAVKAQAQAAANAVVSNVPGAGSIAIGGTRASATDPGGHPSGLALDYMANADIALGNAIVAYHIANWQALGVEYIIYRQRMLSSPGSSWKQMADRGSPTQNHMDHPHVNYR